MTRRTQINPWLPSVDDYAVLPNGTRVRRDLIASYVPLSESRTVFYLHGVIPEGGAAWGRGFMVDMDLAAFELLVFGRTSESAA